MKPTEKEFIQELMETIEQAHAYLMAAESIGGSAQAGVAETVCEAVGVVNRSIGNAAALQDRHSLLIEKKQLETEAEKKEFLQVLADWKELIGNLNSAEPEPIPEPRPISEARLLAKEERLINNSLDAEFYQLMDEISGQTRDKVLYHIRKAFDKLPENFKMNLDEYTTKFQFWGSLHYAKKDFSLLENRAFALKENRDHFVWLYEHLEDYRSKKTLFAILNNWYNFDMETLVQVKEACYKDYFDLDILQCNENEVIVDLGAYIGDSISDYIYSYGRRYKQIYCYEITPATVQVLKNNLKSLPNIIYRAKGASDKKGILYITCNDNSTSANILSEDGTLPVETVAIDEDISEAVTLIKMDIEGSEQAALQGCRNHIQNEHPKLAISVYHNNEDIWKIADMIYAMDSTYRFYLRHNGGNMVPTEYILLAI